MVCVAFLKVFVCAADPSHVLIESLVDVIDVLFKLYVFVSDSVWQARYVSYRGNMLYAIFKLDQHCFFVV